VAQINLLKQNKTSSFAQTGIVTILAKLSMVAVILLAIYYVWTFFRVRSVEGDIKALTERISVQKQELAQVEKRDEVLTRQAQLKELDGLISSHIYWSQLLPELAKVTLKQSTYLSFQAREEAGINLSVQVPTISDLDKFLQVFDSAKLNKYFSDLRIGAINKVQENENTFVRVDVQLKYNPELLKYKTTN
jgi:hypothetical protein